MYQRKFILFMSLSYVLRLFIHKRKSYSGYIYSFEQVKDESVQDKLKLNTYNTLKGLSPQDTDIHLSR